MYQNITLSPLAFNGIKDFNDKTFTDFLGYLLTERILCDKDKILLQEYDNELNKLDTENEITPLKKAIIETLTLNGVIRLCHNISIKKRKSGDYIKYDSEKVLAENDLWKIIVTDEITPELKMKLKIEKDIELADIKEYLTPSEDSRIRTVESIEKNPGDLFDFRNWLLKYITNAKSLIIKDGYICNGAAYKDLEFVIKNVNRSISITIITLSDEARNRGGYKSRNNREVQKKLNDIKNKFSLNNFKFYIIEEKAKLRDRKLLTDLWDINLGHAFGATNGNRVKKQFEISVKTNKS